MTTIYKIQIQDILRWTEQQKDLQPAPISIGDGSLEDSRDVGDGESDVIILSELHPAPPNGQIVDFQAAVWFKSYRQWLGSLLQKERWKIFIMSAVMCVTTTITEK